MALLCEEAARLTQSRLKTKIISTSLKRGPAELTSRLPCIHDEADTLKLLFEGTGDVGSSLVDQCPPCSTGFSINQTCATNGQSRDSVEFFLGWKMMQRFADVCDAHTYDKRFFDRKMVEIHKQYSYMLKEWNDYMFNAMGHNSLAFSGLEYWISYISSNFRSEIEIWGTSDETPTGVAQPFGLPMVRKLLTSVVCGAYDGIITDLDTANALMTLIEAAGGNTAPMLMAESFGVPIMSHGQYNGAPIIVSDYVGRAKTTSTGVAAAASTTFSVPSTDTSFIGFNNRDIGRTFSATGATFGGAATTTIAAVVDPYTVTLAVATDAAITTGTTATLAATNVMYAVRFAPEDGFHFRHPAANGSAPSNVYPCLPSVCGLAEMSLGPLQNCPTIDRTVIQLRGQFALESVYAVAVLAGYDLL